MLRNCATDKRSLSYHDLLDCDLSVVPSTQTNSLRYL